MKVKLTGRCHYCGHEYAKLEESSIHNKLTCLSCKRFIKFTKKTGPPDYVLEEEYVYLVQGTTSGEIVGIFREEPKMIRLGLSLYKILLQDKYE